MNTSTKNLFLITLCIAIFGRIMSWHDITIIPYTAIYVAFIALWGFLAMMDTKWKITLSKSPSRWIMIGLALYYIVFGLSNIANLDFNDTMGVMLRSLLMVAFLMVSVYWIVRLDMLNESIVALYGLFATFMLISFVIFLPQIDIMRTLSTFWLSEEWLRYRVSFGFSANNIAAEYAMSTILLSWHILNKMQGSITLKKIVLYAINTVMFLIIIANNSRGTLIAFVCMFFLNLLLKIIKRDGVKKIVRILLIGMIVILSGLMVYSKITGFNIMELEFLVNRTHFLDNIAALESSGRWILGLGNISGLWFKEGHYLYGVQLNYMEMFYVAVFVTSGILGSIWMATIIIKIIKCIIKYSKFQKYSYQPKWMLSIFAYMLFLSLFEGYLFSYSYATAPCFLLFILAYIEQSYRESIRGDLVAYNM